MGEAEETNKLRNQSAKVRKSIIEDNPILFKDAHRPMTETCMCWGLECGDGWLQQLSDTCAQLEGLNAIFYKLFRVRVQADQVKEKFGTLRFYTTVCSDPSTFVCWYELLMEKLFDKLCSNVDYKLKVIVDQEPWEEINTKVYTDKAQFDKEAAENKTCNVSYIKDTEGRMLKLTAIQHYRKFHREPQQHKLLFWLSKKRLKIVRLIRNLLRWKPTQVQYAAAALLDMLHQKIIREAEHECYNICEECGRHIGNNYSPRCETVGWIKYVCEGCADKMKIHYYKNGELWKESKMLRSKEEVEAEKRTAETSLQKGASA